MPEPILTAADHRELWRVTEQLFPGHPEGAELAPWQMLRVLELVPGPVAERLISHWRAQSDAALDCFVRNHTGQLEHWRGRALAAEGRLAAMQSHPSSSIGPCPVCGEPVAVPLLAGHLELHARQAAEHEHVYEPSPLRGVPLCTFCAQPEPEEATGGA